MTARARHFVPRFLRAPDAAYYLGLSETRFRELVRAGRITGRVVDGGNVMWDVSSLDTYADSLPRDGQPVSEGWGDHRI